MDQMFRPTSAVAGTSVQVLSWGLLAIVTSLPAYAQLRLPEVRVEDARQSPLNMDTPADSASRLGLSVREVPSTVEIVDQEMMTSRGYRSVTEAAQGAAGVTAADFPAEPAAFSMRGYTNSQITTLYNGIKIGPQNMTSRVMDSGNLDRIEFLKGAASLMSGEGAIGGAVNFVTKRPHTGAIENEAYVSYGSFNTVRTGFGSGGSTSKEGLDYRFDLIRSSSNGFVDDTHSQNWNLSTALDYRVSAAFKLFGAFEYKQDRSNAYWGTPLVSGGAAGVSQTGGVVGGSYVSNFNGTNLGPVTIDNRTLRTNYDVLDNRNTAEEYWLRGGFDWKLGSNTALKSQFYGYHANRKFQNAEVYAFNAGTGLVDRDRFYVAHDQDLYGNKTELQHDSVIAGKANRIVVALEASQLDFTRPGAANFPSDSVTLVSPVRGAYGLLTVQQQTANIDNLALAAEDRLKITPALTLISGLRYEQIALDRTSTNVAGTTRAGFPFSQTWRPATGRVGFTWDTMPGFTFYGQYATAADLSANNIFLLGPTQPQTLTRSRTIETGIKSLVWDRKAEWSLALFDIERNNVYTAQGGQSLNLAGEQLSNGVEASLAVRPSQAWNWWGNAAYTNARYADYTFAGGNFSGNKPPNVPRFVANAGAAYRIRAPLPVEFGISARHVGDRYNTDANTVKMLAYTVGDAYAAIDVKKTRITFRVRNLTDKTYAVWGDPFYPDQILLGSPRSYELSAALKF
ncbi:MAG: TonB-dependent receptor family protein [Betaproteobacteria bacterium]|nr:TonB-dependent receptor family protein [Betaproteobacteria bacterium]